MFIKISNLAKQTIVTITNLLIIAKKKQLEKYFARPKTNEEYFNYKKKVIISETTTFQTKKSLRSY